MSGLWAVRETAFSVDSVFPNRHHASSTWYVFEFSQTGEAVEVVRNLSCGVLVDDWVSVRLTAAGAERLLYANPQGLENAKRGPRRGLSVEEGDHCRFSLERWYFVRGLEEHRGASDFLPRNFDAELGLDALPPLPEPGNPEEQWGASDWDADGHPGLAWTVTGAFTGVRNSVQRLLGEYGSPIGDESVVATASAQFTVPMVFDYQEQVLHTSKEGAMRASSTLARTLQPRATLLHLGESPEAVVEGMSALGEDSEKDRKLCLEVSALLPHQNAGDYGLD